MMIRTIILCLFVSTSIVTYGQRAIFDDGPESKLPLKEREELRLNRRSNYEKKLGLLVRAPQGFHEVSTFSMRSPDHSSSSDYIYANKDSSILIVIAILGRDSAVYAKDAAMAKKAPDFFAAWAKGAPNYTGVYDADLQWYINYHSRVDSSVFKPFYYASQRLKAYNVDNGAEFIKAYKEPYLNKYEIIRNVTLNKKYKGIIEIQYFKLHNTKADLEKQITSGYKMIYFNRIKSR